MQRSFDGTFKDLVRTGGEVWDLISRVQSVEQKFKTTTRAMEIPGLGVLVQVTHLQYDAEGKSVALSTSLEMIEDAILVNDRDGNVRIIGDSATPAEREYVGDGPPELISVPENPFQTRPPDEGPGLLSPFPTEDEGPGPENPEADSQNANDDLQNAKESDTTESDDDLADDMTGKTTEIG